MSPIYKKPKLSEGKIQRSILSYLINLNQGFFWRNNTGLFKRKYHFGKVGSADIIGVYKGRFIAIECKASDIKNLDENQETFKERLENCGGIYYLANDYDAFVEWFSNLRNLIS